MTNTVFSNAPRQQKYSGPRADAYINVSLPTETGGKAKIGALTLSQAKESQIDLLQYLADDPSRVVEIMKTAIFDFQLANTGNKIAIPAVVAVPAEAEAPEVTPAF